MAEMRMDNAREPEQLRRMQELAESGECHFCLENFVRRYPDKILHGGPDWYIVKNNFPYEGSVHHYLIVSKLHITKVNEVSYSGRMELFSSIVWLEKYLEVTGESIFVRSGDMDYTGATLDHLHFHFLVGVKKPNQEKDVPEDVIWAPLGYKKK